MARSMFFVVTEDPMVAMRARQFGESCSAEVKIYSPGDWEAEKRSTPVTGVPALSAGQDPVVETMGKVLPFPGPNKQTESDSGKVSTINELESHAIEQAIHVYKGNLTEAAKALGIGRATLYRKVKQYSIDPQQARRRRAA